MRSRSPTPDPLAAKDGAEEQDEGKNASKKIVSKLDTKSLGTVMNYKTGLQRNVTGAMINGNKLNYPNKPFQNKRGTEANIKKQHPDIDDLHLAYQSFRPGLDTQQRFDFQDDSQFYSTRYSVSSYQTRMGSFQNRLKSASIRNNRRDSA